MFRLVTTIILVLLINTNSYSDEFPTGSDGFLNQGGKIWMPVSFFKNWSDANNYCKNTTIDGQSDWRLPMYDELIDLNKSGELKRLGWKLTFTWSSASDSAGTHAAVDLDKGEAIEDKDTAKNYVTCVLDGPG